jgi:DNA-directed RNA polymerase subunit RPC12/RpoP
MSPGKTREEARPAVWKCLRCGDTYTEDYSPSEPLRERSCPRCRSNSVRRVKK